MSLEWNQLLVRRIPSHADFDAAFLATRRNDGLSDLGVRPFNRGVIICVRVVPQATFGLMSLPAIRATLDGHVDCSGAQIDGPCSGVTSLLIPPAAVGSAISGERCLLWTRSRDLSLPVPLIVPSL